MHSGPFGCLTKLGAKRVELVRKFVPRSHVGIFRNKRIRSTPLDRKQTFWCVSYYLGAFGTVWLHYKTRCKMGRTSTKVCATKSRRNFLQRTHPIHPIGPKSNVLVRFVLLGALGTVWLTYKTGCKTGRTSSKLCATKSRRIFLATNAPDPPRWNLN
jgi:hypothetical protein